MSRSALLYILGYADVLRTDRSLPENESEEETNRVFSQLASQPVAYSPYDQMILNAEEPQTLNAYILGMTIEISTDGSLQSTLVAETVLGTLEAFLATALDQRVMPHTEKLHIDLIDSNDASEPSFEISATDMSGTLIWPRNLSPTSFEKQGEVHKFLAEVSGRILATTCIMGNAEDFLHNLFDDEAVQHRMTMAILAANSYNRMASKQISRISDWQEAVKEPYELRTARPTIKPIEPENKEKKAEGKESHQYQPPEMKDHRAVKVQSVIDVHTWDQAHWRGTAYAQFSPTQPPCMAFLFENAESGKKIFERWRERFGNEDKNEEICLSIIRRLPEHNTHHYCVLVTSKLPGTAEIRPGQILSMATRSLMMESNSDVNLERFLESYRHFGAFYLLPAILNGTSPPELLFDHAILKRDLTIKLAADVSNHDVETIALRIREAS